MESTLWSIVASERLRLADLLSDLTPDQWEAQSLCTEWRVRDVAAHVAMTPSEPTFGQMIPGLIRARGDVWVFGRDIARTHAERPVDAIVAELRAGAASRHLPPFTNGENALLDVIVHTQDIARPLGIDHTPSHPGALKAFDRAWTMGWPFWARRRLRGLRIAADDADLEIGDGPTVKGSLIDLVLLVTERTGEAVSRLRGPGVDRLRDLLPPEPSDEQPA